MSEVFEAVPARKREVRVQDTEMYRRLTVSLYAKGLRMRDYVAGSKIGVYRLYRTEVGDFVISKIDARNGAWEFVPNELAGTVVSGDFPILRLREHAVDRLFVSYALSRPITWMRFRDTAIGTTNRRRIQISEFLDLRLFLPPLPEQRIIAAVLDIVRRSVDASERVIAALGELKKSLMRHLFTYGPVRYDEADRVKLKETEIGNIPEQWGVETIGSLFELQQGKAVSQRHRKGISPYPFLRTANVLWGQIDVAQLDQMDFSERERERYALLPNDLLVCEGGDVGRTAIWERQVEAPCFYQNHLHRLRPTDDVESRFYMYWMDFALRQRKLYEGTANRTTIPNLSSGRLSSYQVPYPPIDVQREVASQIATLDVCIAVENNRMTALETLFRTLLQKLITGEVRIHDLDLSAI